MTLTEKDLEKKRDDLEQKEKDLNEKQRQFEIRMREQQERFVKDKKLYEKQYKEKLDAVTKRESNIDQENTQTQHDQEKIEEAKQITLKIQNLETKVKQQQDHIIFIQKDKSSKLAADLQDEAAKAAAAQAEAAQVSTHAELVESNKSNKELIQKVAQIEAKNEVLQGKIDALKAENENMIKASQEAIKNEEKTKDDNLRTFQNQIGTLQQQLIQSQVESSKAKTESDSHKAECNQIKTEFLNKQQSFADEIQKLKDKIKSKNDEIQLMKEDKDKQDKLQTSQVDPHISSINQRVSFTLTQTQQNIEEKLVNLDLTCKNIKNEKALVEENLKEMNHKFKTFKKKYKNLKDAQEVLIQKASKLQSLVAEKDMQIQDLKNNSAENLNQEGQKEIEYLKGHLQNQEDKCTDLEEKLQKAYGSIKNQTREVNKFNKMKETLQLEKDEQLSGQNKQINELQNQLNLEIQDKNDYHSICQDLNNKLSKYENIEKQTKNILDQKENEIADRDDQLGQLDQELSTLKQQQKRNDLKMRQLTHGKLKDLQREIKQKDKKIAELNQKIDGVINGGYKNNSKSQSRNTTGKRTELYDPLASNFGRNRAISSRGGLSQAGGKYGKQVLDSEHQINEVQEDMENTGYLPSIDVIHEYQTPQKLPSIKSRHIMGQTNDDYFQTGGSNFRSQLPQSAKALYNKKISEYEDERKLDKFHNNSRNIGGILGGTSQPSLTKDEQSEKLRSKINSISHVINDNAAMWF